MEGIITVRLRLYFAALFLGAVCNTCMAVAVEMPSLPYRISMANARDALSEINGNLPPQILGRLPEASFVTRYEGETAIFRAFGMDPEFHLLVFSWTWDGAPVGSDSYRYDRLLTDDDVGYHVVRCYLSDDVWSNAVFVQWDVRIGQPALRIDTESLPSGMEAVPYSSQLSASYGVHPYRWACSPVPAVWGANDYGQLDLPVDFNDVVDMDAGSRHCMVLRSDATVAAWGRDDYGQSSVPQGLSNVIAVAAGGWHSLALKSDGTVVAWGRNVEGQTDVPVDASNVVAVAAGGRHNLALAVDGTLTAWGNNNEGQCVLPDGLSNVTDVAGGKEHSLVLCEDGSLLAWGNDEYGQCTIPAGVSDVVGISAGFEHNLALLSNGTVAAWGRNQYGQCAVPFGLSNVVSVCAGFDHSMALCADGRVYAWGFNDFGQCIMPAELSNAVAIAAGGNFSMALQPDSSGMPSGFSLSASGLLSGLPADAGTNLTTFVVYDAVRNTDFRQFELIVEKNPNERPVVNNQSPNGALVEVRDGESVSFSVFASDPEGADLSYAWVWDGLPAGSNDYRYERLMNLSDCGEHILRCYISDGVWFGIVYAEWRVRVTTDSLQIITDALPDGMEAVQYDVQLEATNAVSHCRWSTMSDLKGWGNTVAPTGMNDLVSIDAGIGLRSDGSVVAWHTGSGVPSDVPEGLTNAIAVAAGAEHRLVLCADRTLVAWGGNYFGQGMVPTGMTNVVSIAAGYYHNLAVHRDGSVSAWGKNDDGAINVPSGLSNAVAVAAGSNHSLALQRNGTIRAWGSNGNQQLNIPAGLSNVVAIAAGDKHSLALKSDGTVVGWGYNYNGQCTPPAGLSNVVAIAAGGSHSLALTEDGTVYGWGNNYNNQALVPVGVSNVFAIAAGESHSEVCIQNNSHLPEGMALSLNGGLSGMPTSAETCSVVVGVSDVRGVCATKEFVFTIEENPNQRPVIVSGMPGAGAFSIRENTGSVFAVWAYDPEGENLNYSWTLDGEPVGDNMFAYLYITHPQFGRHHTLRCAVSDNVWSNVVHVEWNITIEDDPLEITSTNLPAGTEMIPYQAQLTATNGIGPYRWAAFPAVKCWGQSYIENVPADVTSVVEVAVGYAHAVALCADGSVTAWGYNYYGQCDVPTGLTNVQAVAAGDDFTMALRDNGTVVVWGKTGAGQNNIPPGLGGVVAIAAGHEHCIALKEDGTVAAWGNNYHKQCDVPVTLRNVDKIAVGFNHNLAVRSDGTVVSWGRSQYGEGIVPLGLTNVIDVSAGEYYSTALKADGTVAAWGDNTYGQCSVPGGLTGVVAVAAGKNGSLALRSDGTLVRWGAGYYDYNILPAGISNVVYVARGFGGGSVSIFSDQSALPDDLSSSVEGVITGVSTLADTNKLPCLVYDSIGDRAFDIVELVVQTNQNARPVFVSHTPTGSVFQMIDGDSKMFFVDAEDPEGADLELWWTLDGQQIDNNDPSYLLSTGWRMIGHHQLRCYASDGFWTNEVYKEWTIVVRSRPLEMVTDTLPDGMEMVPYSAQLVATNGVKPYRWSLSGISRGWGRSYNGELSGIGGSGYVAIDGGLRHSVALRSDGTLEAWGNNEFGQLNIPEEATNIIAVSVARYHNLALRADGTVLAWGYNGDGQSDVPDGLSNAVAVSVGAYHSLALKDDGTLVAWGRDSDSQSTIPANLDDVIAISAGDGHNLALRSDGTVFAWGRNTDLQCNVPPGLSNVIAVAAGGMHSLALCSNGTVFAWGDGDFSQSTVPSGLNNVVAIAAGGRHSLALCSDGCVRAWGDNMYSQSYVPSSAGSNVAFIGCGDYHSLALTEDSSQLPEGYSFSSDGILSGQTIDSTTNQVCFVVRDLLGQTVFRELELRIEPHTNQRPVIEYWLPLAQHIDAAGDSNMIFMVVATDQETQDLDYLWTWDGEVVGKNLPSTGKSLYWDQVGQHTMRCYVSDDMWTNRVYTEWTVHVLADSDHDTLPDQWEAQYGNLSQFSWNGDCDGDGMRDFEEYLAGTNPTVTNEWPHIESVEQVGGAWEVSFETVSNRTYQVLVRTNLISGWWNWWEVQGDGDVQRIYDINNGNADRVYYRLRVCP